MSRHSKVPVYGPHALKGRYRSSIHSFLHSFIRWLALSFIHSYGHSFLRSFKQSIKPIGNRSWLNGRFAHHDDSRPIHRPTCRPAHKLTIWWIATISEFQSFIRFLRSFIPSFLRSFIHSFLRSVIHSFIQKGFHTSIFVSNDQMIPLHI